MDILFMSSENSKTSIYVIHRWCIIYIYIYMKYINKIENRITFKIKPEYYLELLTPETMKLVGSTISTIRSKWCKCALFRS